VTPYQIELDIEAEREQLGKNLEYLESRIKQATDWREVLGRNPMAALGAAFGVGFLISLLTRGSPPMPAAVLLRGADYRLMTGLPFSSRCG
jgi:hypothetical protein